jgi:DNA-binding transcriptional ArsR family regulator
MSQPAPKLRLVEAPSTGYARKAWISHVIETAPDEVGGTELAVLKELADLVDDAAGWAEASYQKLAHRTRLSERTVRRAVKVLAAAGLVEPELIGGRAGEGRARIRYGFPAMHAWLAERKARHHGGQRDHGRCDHGQRARPTLVTQSENLPPLKEPIQEPGARAREADLDLGEVTRRLAKEVPPLARMLEGCELGLGGGVLRVWVPPRLEGVLRASEGMLRTTVQRCGLADLRLGRISERPRTAGAAT